MKKLTQAEFISRSLITHNNKYSYDKAIYKTIITKINIICPLHGEFYQRPYDHINGHGCKKCQYDNMRKDKEFVDRVSIIHNNKYDYSKVKYIGSNKKVIIICPFHGEFLQEPSRHLRHGCKRCAKMDFNDFLSIVNIKHNNKYIYTDYHGKRRSVKITCPIHGVFTMPAATHIKGKECPDCEKIKKRIEFINKSNTIYNNKYDYSKIKYINKKTKVEIICPIHGIFLKTPLSHLNNSGCAKCMAHSRRISFQEFLSRAKKIHNKRYTYNEKEYKGFLVKTKISCSSHGIFIQTARDHSRGSGCPLCAHNRVSKSSQLWLNSLGVAYRNREKMIKINGKTLSVDAFEKESNTIYEYFGYFWHGHPKKFDPEKIHPINGVKFKTLYKKTLSRIKLIENSTFNFIYIWGI